MNVLRCLLLILVSFVSCEAILTGGDNNRTTTDQQQSITNSFKVNNETNNNNNTFYYEADTFLLNKNEQKSGQATTEAGKSEEPPPASIGSTSARSGRMLDLDALVGDFAASQSVKARSQSGNRQSRFLSTALANGAHSLEVGKGKKLHIQGFIPIVGVKDVTGDEESTSDLEPGHHLLQASKKQLQVNNDEQLPYAMSSIGHASFIQPAQRQQQQQVDAKYIGGGGQSTVVDTLRKPLKKLMRFGEAQQQQQLAPAGSSIQRQQQNCLCVPFYMCKNGFISESSLTGSHVQQMIMQQQQLAQVQPQPKAAQLMIAPSMAKVDFLQPNSNNQFATFSAQVDERSLDRDIITMSPLALGQDQQLFVANQTANSPSAEQQAPSLAPNNFDGEAVNTTSSEAIGSGQDYSQEILGRMLGIKALIGSKQSSVGQESSNGGVCGMLRTCCNIPTHLTTSGQHQDLLATGDPSGQHQMSFSATNQPPATITGYSNRYSSVRNQPSEVQRYQQSSAAALQRGGGGYGFPSQQNSRMQPLNNPDHQLSMMTTALAHRSSSMFSPQSGNRFQQQAPLVAQPGDFKRAPHQMQHVPSSQVISLPSHSLEQSSTSEGMTRGSSGPVYNPSGYQQPPATNELGLGTRKILEGRCGLRQSAGINGRVQNLQYQENAADFGEYPAQAAILKRLSGTDSMFVCGGTLISQYWIATAAHCIKKHSINDLKIRLGEWDIHRDDEFYPYVEKGIRDLVVHSEFVPGNLVNDIALLRLDSPVDASLPHVNPACLPTLDESFAHQRCWVTGWGKDSFGQKGSFQTVLQEVELSIVGQAECESALRQTRLGPHYRLHSGFICAGGEGGKDACEGDGGSGLYCMQDGLIKVAGLVSWGIGCGQPGVPGVYVNLAHYRPWIENIISIDEDIYSRSSSNSTTPNENTTTASPANPTS